MANSKFLEALSDSACEPSEAFLTNLKSTCTSVIGTGGGAAGGSSILSQKIVLPLLITGLFAGVTILSATKPWQSSTDLTKITDDTSQWQVAQNTRTEDVSESLVSDETSQDTPSETQETQATTPNTLEEPVQDTSQTILPPEEDPPANVTEDPPEIQIGTFNVEFWKMVPFKGAPGFPAYKADSTSVATSIDYNWGNESPDPANISADYFVMRAAQTRDFEPGTYEIYYSSDDGLRIYVNEELMVDTWASGGKVAGFNNFTIPEFVEDGSVVIQYFDEVGLALVEVSISKL